MLAIVDFRFLLQHNRFMADTLQIKLSMDPGLKAEWDFLLSRYNGLDKASIVRLALNELSYKEKKSDDKKFNSMSEIMDEIDRVNVNGPTEEEFFEWWNENKKSLR